MGWWRFFSIVFAFQAIANDPKQSPFSWSNATQSARGFQVPDGFKVEPFAVEPQVLNPISFSIDDNGKIYVVEISRLENGVPDIRQHMKILDEDLACRTVEERHQMMLRNWKNPEFLTRYDDRIRLLHDQNGDGKVDKTTVFASGFNGITSGLGAGVLSCRDQVWFACIPDLWLLKDQNGDGTADHQTRLSSGYGVHIGYIGHDLHGLRMGPDGKIYFTIGDRGSHVSIPGGVLSNPDTGAVFKSNPDGTNLEVYATGLRNPQELAFDDYGNLFTVDNNADSGDKARLVYVVEGGDSGWRIGYQFMENPIRRGPWNIEKLWHLPHKGQAGYIIPPVAHIADGPSGFTHYPGTGFDPRFNGHFFLADFRGGASYSGIRSFHIQPKDAYFELVSSNEFLWSVLATDVDFGPDGALYLSDWVEGWGTPNKGRIYRLFDTSSSNSLLVREVKDLLAGAIKNLSTKEWLQLLSHPDQRIRQRAQFHLVEQSTGRDGCTMEKRDPVPPDRTEILEELLDIVSKGSNQFGKLHSIWALGQIGDSNSLDKLVFQLSNPDPEIRSQILKVLGDNRFLKAETKIRSALLDRSRRVKFFAGIALSKIGAESSLPNLMRVLSENEDPFVRHAIVMALSTVSDKKLHTVSKASFRERLGVVLALRRKASATIVNFLEDSDPGIVLEVARAVYDLPIASGLSSLAELNVNSQSEMALVLRIMAANFRLGNEFTANRLADFAGRPDIGEVPRVEALAMLTEWENPSGRDRVTGSWRPLGIRDKKPAIRALETSFDAIWKNGGPHVRLAFIKSVSRLGVPRSETFLLNILSQKKVAVDQQIEALLGLERLKSKRLKEAVVLALKNPSEGLRKAALRILITLDPVEALPILERSLDNGSIQEQQGAFSCLREMALPTANTILLRWMDKLLNYRLPKELELDLLEAVRAKNNLKLNEKLAEFERTRYTEDILSRYSEVLWGGNARTGSGIFYQKPETACLRCHRVYDQGGTVGPELTGIGKKQTRQYLLESIIDPNRKIAEGFESIILALTSGEIKLGIIQKEDDDNIRLIAADGKEFTVKKSEIEERKVGISAMPVDVGGKLSKFELRDLIEFLSNL